MMIIVHAQSMEMVQQRSITNKQCKGDSKAEPNTERMIRIEATPRHDKRRIMAGKTTRGTLDSKAERRTQVSFQRKKMGVGREDDQMIVVWKKTKRKQKGKKKKTKRDQRGSSSELWARKLDARYIKVQAYMREFVPESDKIAHHESRLDPMDSLTKSSNPMKGWGERWSRP